MVGRVDGKIVLITGAASGIGRGTALMLAREGAVVVGADLQSGPGETRSDTFAELKDRIHLAVISDLGPRLYNESLSPTSLHDVTSDSTSLPRRHCGRAVTHSPRNPATGARTGSACRIRTDRRRAQLTPQLGLALPRYPP